MRRLLVHAAATLGATFLPLSLALLHAQEAPVAPAAPAQKAAPEGKTIEERVVVGAKIVEAEKKEEPAAEKEKEAPKAAEKKAAPRAALRIMAVPAKAARAMPAKVAVAEAPNLDPIIQQYIPQFVPIVRAELYLLRSVCELSPDQQKKLSQERERALKEAAKKFVEAQQRPQLRGGFPEPDTIVQESLAETLKSLLTPDQAARYEAESKERSRLRKQVAAHNVVALLDQEMCLSRDQREKLCESLAANWDDDWCSSLQSLEYGLQFFPNIPDRFVTPHLNPLQKKIWTSIPKNHRVFFGFNSEVDNAPLDDESAEAPKATGGDVPPAK